MAQPDEAAVRAVLGTVADPATGRTLDPARIEAVQVKDALVAVSLLTERAQAAAMAPWRVAIERALAAIPGVRNASVVLTAHSAAGPASPATVSPPGGPPPGGQSPVVQRGAARPPLLADVGAVVAVASGKGGVGKSTVAVNLAVALAQAGQRVGLLDADIYGPSLPRMLGVDRKPDIEGNRMVPIQAWGLLAMSIGFLVEAEAAMIWRGPMVMGALEQMMGQVVWPALDIMIVDMPPGTGDAQLTMAQRVALAGAVIVSTPQDIALIDARRGVAMFEKTRVPVLGLVENMSFYCCPNCGHRAELFGHGGARREAERLGVEFLGEIPLLVDIRAAADAGTPIVAAAPDSVAARAYTELAARLLAKLQTTRGAQPGAKSGAQLGAKSGAAGPRIIVS